MSLPAKCSTLLSAFIPALILATAFIPTGCATEPAPRGIILISADTMGAGHLGLYGYGPGTSPNIDRWAEDAIVFRNAFAQLPGTLPSHMSMMTGLSPRQHGVYPSQKRPIALSSDIPTLAEHLNHGGYRTAGFTEGGYVAGVFGFKRGFDQFHDRFKCWPDVLAAAEEFLDSLEPGQHFFLFLHTYDVHDPYEPPEEHRLQFTPPPGPLSIEPRGSNLIAVNRGRKKISTDDVDQLRALYDAGISNFDQQFNSLLEMLAQTGLGQRTMLILTADHGEEFMEHGRLAHETTFNPAIHVPLVIQVPDWQGNRNVQSMVELTDLPATILSWAGLPQTSFQGTDLLALAGADTEPDRSFAFSESLIDQNRVVLGRVNGRRLKLMAKKPRLSTNPVACGRVSGLIARGPEVTIRLRTVGPPLELSVYHEGGRLHTWMVKRHWSTRTIRFETGENEGSHEDQPHTLLFSYTEGERRAGGESAVASNPLRISSPAEGSWVIPWIRLYDLDADPSEVRDAAANELPLTKILTTQLARRLHQDNQVSPPEYVVYSEQHRQRLQALGYLE